MLDAVGYAGLLVANGVADQRSLRFSSTLFIKAIVLAGARCYHIYIFQPAFHDAVCRLVFFVFCGRRCIALDMLQVVRYILGSSCRVGWIDRGCEKQSARTRDSEVLKRSFQKSTCLSWSQMLSHI